MEDDYLPLLPVNIYSLTELTSGACEPPQVTVAFTLAQGLEQVQVLAVQGVVPDGPVASDKLLLLLLLTNLPLDCVASRVGTLGIFRCRTKAISPVSVSMVNVPLAPSESHENGF